MSVIVKGMKMPSNCAHCICAHNDTRYCTAAHEYIPMLGKPDFCPLVELPDHHGRLVDAGECAEYFWEHLDDNGMAGAMNAINDMPTIVEAEEEE